MNRGPANRQLNKHDKARSQPASGLRLSKNLNLKKNCHCEAVGRGNPHPQNLTVLDALQPKW